MKDEKYKLASLMIIILTTLIIVVGFSMLSKSISTSMKDRNKEPIYFGATYMTMNNPYFEVINNDIRERVKANGDELITMDPALSLEKQIQQIRYLISQNVKVIFLNSVDNTGLHDVLKECRKAKIKVIAIDTNLKEEDYTSCTIVSDNYNAGVKAAQNMMSRKSSAKIFLLRHSQVTSGKLRIQGFIDTIQNESQFEIVGSEECEGQLEKAMPIVSEHLEKGLEFDVVMALNDPAAMGALAAMQEYNRKDILVYGIDGSPETKQLILNNEMDGGTVAQSPLTMGKKAVKAAYRLLENKKVELIELTPVEMITSENIHEFSVEGWQ